MLKLEDLGWNPAIARSAEEVSGDHLFPGRVILEHRERYIVLSPKGEYQAEVTGNLRYAAESPLDFPAVGDWVWFQEFEPGQGIIHRLIPRINQLTRPRPGRPEETQVLAANVDRAFIVMGADRDFNLNRMERYLLVCLEAKIEPLVVLSKIDLAGEAQLPEKKEALQQRAGKAAIIPVNNLNREGYEQLAPYLEPGKTICCLGSSGAGKSTLINRLLEQDLLETRQLSSSTGKGKHTTSRREMLILPGGSLLIDTPGLREIGVTAGEESLDSQFSVLAGLATACRYPDCSHTGEPGCAVLAALEEGQILQEVYDHYLKLERESQRHLTSLAEKRRKDRDTGKLHRYILDLKKKNRF